MYSSWPVATISLCCQNGKLAIRHKNAELCCGDYTLTPSVRVDGDDIYCDVVVDYRSMANCVCHLDVVQNLVSGLKKGHGYTLHYSFFGGKLVPIDFTYSSLLNFTLDYDQNLAPFYE